MSAQTASETAKMPHIILAVDLGIPLPQILDAIARTLAREAVETLGTKKAAACALGLSRRSLQWYLEGSNAANNGQEANRTVEAGA